MRPKFSKRKGISGTIEQAVLLALTIALFLTLVVGPAMHAVNFLSHLPATLNKNLTSAVKWIDENVARLFTGS